jgi:CubicO group peptidase (beta-lactamase class C family)
MPRKPVTTDNWTLPPFNRNSFQRVQTLFPTARLCRGPGCVAEIGSASGDLGDVTYTRIDHTTDTLRHLLSDTYTDAFLVAKDERILCEQYFNGMRPDSHHLLNSVTKSLVGMLSGIVVARGQLDPDALVTEYLPEFADGAFAETRVRHTLDMTAAVAFDEDYDDPQTDFWVESAVAGWRPELVTDELPRSLHDYARGLGERAQHDGEKFCYRTVLTNVLGMVLERATGTDLAELLENALWSRLGAEHDASIVVDRIGFPYVGAGMSCSARDLLRFGLMIANEGRLGGEQIVPAEWVQDTRRADAHTIDAFARGEYGEVLPGAHYRNQCWVTDPIRGVILGVGIFGQTVYVNLATQTVIVKLSSQPRPRDLEMFMNSFAAMDAVSEAL